jgi:hypothetical protein
MSSVQALLHTSSARRVDTSAAGGSQSRSALPARGTESADRNADYENHQIRQLRQTAARIGAAIAQQRSIRVALLPCSREDGR